ncbi:MAG: FliM/FliN family flagellar motor switch protein [Pseudomonadota bacterium]
MSDDTAAVLNTDTGEGSSVSVDEGLDEKPASRFDRAVEELADPAFRPNASLSNAGRSTASAALWDIPVELSVLIGSTQLSVAKLMELESGSLIELSRKITEPLDILVNGRAVAKGEIVAMPDNPDDFGIRITEMLRG